MNIELSPKAAKHLKSMSEPGKSRIIRALKKLPQGDVAPLQGINGLFRLRVGGWRIVFSRPTQGSILIEQIAPRGLYKGGF